MFMLSCRTPFLVTSVVVLFVFATNPRVRGQVVAERASDAPVRRGIPHGWAAIGDQLVSEHQDRATIGNVNFWPGIVPYEFDANVSSTNRGRARDAMDEIEAVCNVTFVPRNGETSYLDIFSGTGNFAAVGRTGIGQPVSIVSWHAKWIIVHEFLHSLGFWHEHQRPDRDQFIQINDVNIQSGREGNFVLLTNATTEGTYDFDSLMHYDACSFSIDCPPGATCNCDTGTETITVLAPNQGLQNQIGQRTHMSLGDIAGLVAVYGSPDCDNNGTRDFDDIQNGTLLDCNQNGVPDVCEGVSLPDCNNNGTADGCEPELDCTGNGIPDSCDIANGTADDCNNNGIADECELGWDCDGSGVSDWCEILSGQLLDDNSNNVPDQCEVTSILYVDGSNVSGNADGASWATAFVNPQEALAAARDAPNVVTAIWVAQGTYKPDVPGGARSSTFDLVDRIRMYGGFLGNETVLEQRDPRAFVTVLSGDLNGDDGPGFTNRSDNSYTVVSASILVGPDTIFDGFKVVGGQSDGPGDPFFAGGGMDCRGDLTISRCVFTDNTADAGAGGGIYCWYLEPTIVNCEIYNNRALLGGGIFLHGAVATLFGNLVYDNHATGSGNMGGHGGGIVTFQGNSLISNCTFAFNTANTYGAGLATTIGGDPVLTGCIFWGNTLQGVGGEASQLGVDTGTIRADYSIVEGWTGTLTGVSGSSTSASDPMFVDEVGRDLALQAGSVCIDSGNNGVVPLDATDVDQDGDVFEGLPLDVLGVPRRVDDPSTADTGVGNPAIIDIGALEFVPAGLLCACEWTDDVPPVVDVNDLLAFLSGWFVTTGNTVVPGTSDDFDGNGMVDVNDLLAFLACWFVATSDPPC